jgi:pyruvate dehydrogenase E2 component (dihydrolipoamide acetyltransferase)
MATRVDVPQLGLTMETGTILQWVKAEGETVEKGQPVVVIQTDKVEYEVEAPVAGTVLKIAAREGEELPVGSLMCVIGAPGEDVSGLLGATRPAAGPAEAPSRVADSAVGGRVSGDSRSGSSQLTNQPVDQSPPQAPVRGPGERVKVSPVAKKLAQEHGIDVGTLRGTGPEGRIVREDVELAIVAMSHEPRATSREGKTATPEIIPLSGTRKVIFDRMGQSWREAARVTLFADADMTALVRLRERQGADWERRFGVKPS